MNKELKEILWNIINSLLAGALVLLGNLSNGNITIKGLELASIAAAIVCIMQFKNYWDSEKPEFCNPKIFNFLKL